MPIRVLVSCASDRTEFIKCIKNVCDEYKDELECHFISNETAQLEEHDLLNRMVSLVNESNIVLMDVTPQKYSPNGNEVYLTNSGVLIEYGVLASSPANIGRLCLFCENTVSRNLLHPYFIKTAHQYSQKELNDEKASKSLRRQVKEIINNYKKGLGDMVRKLQKENAVYENYTNILKKS